MGTTRRGVSILDLLNEPITPPQSPESKRRRPNPGRHSEPRLSGSAVAAAGGTPDSNVDRAAEANVTATIENDSTCNTVGQVVYPVHTQLDSEARRQLDRFCVAPTDTITRSASHVAFSSEKRDFYIKTGRNGFEVFTYTFRYSEQNGTEAQDRDLGGDPEWIVMWDYNIGLVRIASLFKWQTKYLKTMPQRALSSTPGLKDLSHNITGGKTNCQGFWIPFEAAKALAATFCWKIRYALTPMFGPDFVGLCVAPDDENFRNHTIDESIIRRCNEQAKMWRRLAKSYQCEPLREGSKSESPASGGEQASTPEISGRLRLRPLAPAFTMHQPKTDSQSGTSGTLEGTNLGPAIKSANTAASPGAIAKPRSKRQAAGKARDNLLRHQSRQTTAITPGMNRQERRDMHQAASKLVEMSRDAHAHETSMPGTFSWVNDSSKNTCDCSGCRSMRK